MPPIQLNSSPHEIRRSESVGTLVLSEVLYPPGFKLAWHSHEMAAFALTLQGSSTEAFAGNRFERTESGIVLRPAGERHSDTFGAQGAKCFLIEFRPSWNNEIPQFGQTLHRPSLHPPGAITRLAQRAYAEWLENDAASKIGVQALVLEMVANLVREGAHCRSNPPAWLRRIKQRLDDDVSETPSLTELAAVAGVHPTHLARHFRQHYGASIGEYVRARRVDAATQLLQQNRLSLTEIALAVGFSHHAHFTTVFKRLIGMTPSEFRRLRH